MPNAQFYLVLIFAFAMLVALARSARIISQYEKGLVLRLGRYRATVGSGLTFLVPVKDVINGQILQGINKPGDCTVFGKECTPERPLGATMVSSEGACAAYYRYGLTSFTQDPYSTSKRVDNSI